MEPREDAGHHLESESACQAASQPLGLIETPLPTAGCVKRHRHEQGAMPDATGSRAPGSCHGTHEPGSGSGVGVELEAPDQRAARAHESVRRDETG